MDSAAADCGVVDLTFHRTNFPPDELSAYVGCQCLPSLSPILGQNWTNFGPIYNYIGP